MAFLKRALVFLKDLCTGALYPALSIGLMMLIAAALILIRPMDFLGDPSAHPVHSEAAGASGAADALLALRLLKMGTALALGGALVLMLVLKIEAWWRQRPKKAAADAPGDKSAP